jgi:hypothetical protein
MTHADAQHLLDLLATFPNLTVTSGSTPGVIVDPKKGTITFGPPQTMDLATLGIGLPMRGELVAAAIQKQWEAMTPATAVQAIPRQAPGSTSATPARRWFWIGGGALGGVLLTLLLTRRG